MRGNLDGSVLIRRCARANAWLTNMMDAVGTTAYTYTDFGALLSEDGPWADDTVSYTYTSNRLRSGMTLLQPNATAWSQTYTYDSANRLTGIASPAGSFSYTYDPLNNMLVRKLALPNGSYITNGFDPLGRMTSTTLKNSSHTILNSHQYTYDDASRRTKQTRVGTLSTASVTNSVDYGYDPMGQLKSALGTEADGTSRPHERFFYGYDKAGNLSNRVQNVLTNVFNVDSLNQLTSTVRTNSSLTVAGTTTSSATNVTVADNGNSPVAALRYADATFARTNVTLLNGTNAFTAVAADNLGRWDTNTVTSYLPAAVTFLYDQNGNLRTNGTRIFEYDDENQLTRITEPNAWKSEFTYDGKMKMRISKDYTWQGGGWVQTNEVRRLYDGMLVIQERDIFNLPRLTYTRGKDLSGSLAGAGGIGGLLAISDLRLAIPEHACYHADGNGNVTALVDTNQVVVARYLFDPFGSTLSAVGIKATLNKYRFSSKEGNELSGMFYYGYRFYEPRLARWLNRDPKHEAGGINLFTFVRNRTPSQIDPLGLDWVQTGSMNCYRGECWELWENRGVEVTVGNEEELGPEIVVRSEFLNANCQCVRRDYLGNLVTPITVVETWDYLDTITYPEPPREGPTNHNVRGTRTGTRRDRGTPFTRENGRFNDTPVDPTFCNDPE